MDEFKMNRNAAGMHGDQQGSTKDVSQTLNNGIFTVPENPWTPGHSRKC